MASPEDDASHGSSTRSVHAGERRPPRSPAVTTPIHQTATFWFEDSEEVRAYAEGRHVRDEYGRYSNPTWRAAEEKLAALEGGEGAVLFASGMAAATSSMLELLPQGGHLVVTGDCYRRTRQFFRDYLTKLGVEVSVVPPADAAAIDAALRPDTSLVFTESPTNPYLRVIDLPAVVASARRVGARVMVDSTFASPVNYRPLDEGADLVVHSATKYLAGHNDVLAGAIVGSGELLARVRGAAGVLGGILDPHAAYLLLRGMKTLALRMSRHNENGARVARWLEARDEVRRVFYPSLESHPDHEVAMRSMKGFGGVVSFDLDTDLEGAMRFTDACRLPYIAPSLGGVESLIEMPALMSYWDLDPGDRAELGIGDSLIRLACGIEDGEDLIADLDRGLAAIGRGTVAGGTGP